MTRDHRIVYAVFAAAVVLVVGLILLTSALEAPAHRPPAYPCARHGGLRAYREYGTDGPNRWYAVCRDSFKMGGELG